ncbi:MAG: hypothetical protein C5B46_09645 [Proteobacteria bacterium]|nr:MAG: hypothetical protein C5B46_09645 [Pseudomonadota bacterium]
MSQRWWRVVCLTVAALSAGGCTVKSQSVRVAPPVTVNGAEAERSSRTVAVAAFDVRADQKLGIITDAHDRTVDVATAGDVPAALLDSVSQGLVRSGFKTKALGNDDPATLQVELQELTFNALKRPLDFDVALKVIISARARNGSDSYDRTYTVSQQKLAGAPPSSTETTQMVNSAIGFALSDMLADKELTNLLTR